MSEIRSQCEGCGMCCRAIFIPISHEEIAKESERTDIPADSDKAFAIANWYPITKEEALQRNPHLQTWYDAWASSEEDIDADPYFENNFYACRNLDEETGRCKVHETRPRVCSGYPWYDKQPSETHMFYAEDCYYKRDLQDVQTAENMQDSIHA